jgi:hypothetical protein
VSTRSDAATHPLRPQLVLHASQRGELDGEGESRPIVEELDLRDDRNNTSVERDDDAMIEIIVRIFGGNLVLLFVHIGADWARSRLAGWSNTSTGLGTRSQMTLRCLPDTSTRGRTLGRRSPRTLYRREDFVLMYSECRQLHGRGLGGWWQVVRITRAPLTTPIEWNGAPPTRCQGGTSRMASPMGTSVLVKAVSKSVIEGSIGHHGIIVGVETGDIMGGHGVTDASR